MVRQSRVPSSVIALEKWIKNLFVDLLKQQWFWALLLINAVSKILMVCVESQVPFILFLDVPVPFKLCSFGVLYVFAEHFSLLSPSELLLLALSEDVIVRQKIEKAFKLFDFSCVVNIFFAFGRHIWSYHFYLYSFEIFEVKVAFLPIVVRVHHLMFIDHVLI